MIWGMKLYSRDSCSIQSQSIHETINAYSESRLFSMFSISAVGLGGIIVDCVDVFRLLVSTDMCVNVIERFIDCGIHGNSVCFFVRGIQRIDIGIIGHNSLIVVSLVVLGVRIRTGVLIFDVRIFIEIVNLSINIMRIGVLVGLLSVLLEGTSGVLVFICSERVWRVSFANMVGVANGVLPCQSWNNSVME